MFKKILRIISVFASFIAHTVSILQKLGVIIVGK